MKPAPPGEGTTSRRADTDPHVGDGRRTRGQTGVVGGARRRGTGRPHGLPVLASLEPPDSTGQEIALGGYGFRWLRLQD